MSHRSSIGVYGIIPRRPPSVAAGGYTLPILTMDKSDADPVKPDVKGAADDLTTRAADLHIAANGPTAEKVDSLQSDVRDVMVALTAKAPDLYILIGGSSLILYGSTRTTNDIDLLVRRASVPDFVSLKEAILRTEAVKYIEKIDLLTEIGGRFDFDSIAPFTIEVAGVKIAPLEVLLGTKILGHYQRSEGVEGDKKRASDLSDINWICQELKKNGRKVRGDVSGKLVCGPYNMLLVVTSLYETYGRASLEVFEEVGGREFECNWGTGEFEEQAELYEMEVEDAGFGEDELRLLGSRKKVKAMERSHDQVVEQRNESHDVGV